MFAPKLRLAGWSSSVDRIRESGISPTALVDGPGFLLEDHQTWANTQSQFIETIDAAAAMGAPTVYTLTGRHFRLGWDEVATLYVEAMQPVIDHARKMGVQLAVEPTNPLYADLSFVHTVADALALVTRCGMSLCVDIYHVWTEARLDEALSTAADRLALVQVSDYVFGDRSMPSRAVPGDGDIPLKEILDCVLDTGYQGLIDLELSGPRIDAEGHIDAARRGATFIEDLLTRDRPSKS
jgi:sugar phosphate isomerase/epimerase